MSIFKNICIKFNYQCEQNVYNVIMPKGMSLHVGLNYVDPAKYQGWDGELKACHFDANDTTSICKTYGFETTTLLDDAATSSTVLQRISQAASTLDPGDIFVLSYAGHGSQILDVSGDDEDQMDETWCLWDRMLLDDELYAMWARFQPGVRIFMISDSCHSGTMARLSESMGFLSPDSFVRFRESSEKAGSRDSKALLERIAFEPGEAFGARVMPQDVAVATYVQDKTLYDSIQWSHLRSERQSIGASVILLSGCQDNQTSGDGKYNGTFTAAMKAVWDGGKFKGSYKDFAKRIISSMPPYQTPNYYKVGLDSPAFEAETPFTISRPRSNRGEERTTMERCRMEIEVSQGSIARMTPEEVERFLKEDAVPVLMEAYKGCLDFKQVARDAGAQPRGGSVEVGCKAEGGKVSCEGKVSIGF